MYLNFGEIGAINKSLVQDYQEKLESQTKVESIADMKVRSTDICFERDYDQWQ